MIDLWLIVLFSCAFLIGWTYLFFPVLLLLFGRKKKNQHATELDNFPVIHILFAAYNEATVIEEKIESCFNSHYPIDKIKVTVGSDNSTDGTDELLQKLEQKYPNLRLVPFKARTGKTGILNALAETIEEEYLVLTDANIIFTKNTLPTLMHTLQTENVGIVGGTIVYRSQQNKSGISEQETVYLNLENRIKSAESNLFKQAMGVEGGCYLIQRKLFPTIPATFFMEDFFVTMSVLQKGESVLVNQQAVVYEDVSTQMQEEYKRKVRISIGNWQNLNHFKGILLTHFWPTGFLFLSHKVLRWLTPFLLLFALVALVFLAMHLVVFQYVLLICAAIISMALVGVLFSHSKGLAFLKFPAHFFYMNLALLHGFIKYTKGIESNVWQPTKRNQK